MRSKSDFTYTIANDVLRIIDLNYGRMSVTNDIENVLEHIKGIEGFMPSYTIYRDSEGSWDAVTYDGSRASFYLLAGTSEDDAINLLENNIKRTMK